MAEYPIIAVDKLDGWLKNPSSIGFNLEDKDIFYQAIASVDEFVVKEAYITDSDMLSKLIIMIQSAIEDFEKENISKSALKQKCNMIGMWVNQKSIMSRLAQKSV